MTTMILAQAEVTGHSKYAQQITAAAHHLTSDEPSKRGGDDTGPAPFDLLLASVGACTSITLRMYSERKNWDLGTITVKLRLLKDGDGPPRIERKMTFTGTLDADQQSKLLEIADKTPVTRAIGSGIPMTTTIVE